MILGVAGNQGIPSYFRTLEAARKFRRGVSIIFGKSIQVNSAIFIKLIEFQERD